MWKPKTAEDQLLSKYIESVPGKFYLEVPVGFGDGQSTSRRIDGVLIPGDSWEVYPRGTVSNSEQKAAFEGKHIYILEAKRELNRGVIGQVLVGLDLISRDYNPLSVKMVVVCGRGQVDLEWVCARNNIEVFIGDFERRTTTTAAKDGGVRDVRQPPDSARLRAFQAGWTAAVNGKLFASTLEKRTHANMGNMFG
ncbi:MAG: hypothetical protein FH749_02570 [Firmicutes bacterium]|nr:hypothetical protein [Bacillota bacterium]